MTDTDLLGPGSGDEPAPEPDDREALARALYDAPPTHKRQEEWEDVSDTGRGYWRQKAEGGIAAGFRRHPEPVKPSRGSVRSAVGGVLFLATNYPEAVQPRILGQNMGPLMDLVTDAVMETLPGRSAAEEPPPTGRCPLCAAFIDETDLT